MNPIYIIIAVVVVILLILIWYISTSNKIYRYIIKIDEAVSGIDVALSKRYNVLTKMIEVVKSYNKHEKEVLFEIINLRKGMSIQELNDVNRAMDENFRKIDIVTENYPELKANENYKILQQSITDVEEHLQAARRLYNSNVSLYNQLIESFPSNIVAKRKKAKKKDFFAIEDTTIENMKIDL